MSEAQTTILDLDNMMDVAMDSVETLPDYVTPPDGNYLLEVTEAKIERYTPKKKKDSDPEPAKDSAARIKIGYAVKQTIECGNELPVADGSLFSESFMANEDGLKYFKRKAMNILNVKDFAGASMKDVISGLAGAAFTAKITTRKTPNPAGGFYENTQVRPVHETPPV